MYFSNNGMFSVVDKYGNFSGHGCSGWYNGVVLS